MARYGYGTGYVDPETAATLPEAGERLAFGTHRLPEGDRWCPAWPERVTAEADRRHAAQLRAAAAAITPPPCVDCGGPVTVKTGGKRTYGEWDTATGTAAPDTFRHPDAKWSRARGVYVSACDDYRAANPWAAAAALADDYHRATVAA